MKILSMTATFGKLEHQSLRLEPGLNIIQAPNEWGKSTWCAFLVNMLYGIDTRARSTGTTLADKDRYAPWSGAAMSGRIDLDWNGRRITIERSSKGRIAFGEFRAYETESGMDVPELTATNCGQQLLGVERSVYTRAGFLRLADLPVTQDDALRRRLNSLVTTGDESGAGDKLGQTLKDLKNKCRFNNTGLLPQAENEREQLRRQLQNLQQLNAEAQSIGQRQEQIRQQLDALANHQAALRYNASVEGMRQVEAAEQEAARLEQQSALLKAQCATVPSQEQLQQQLEQVQAMFARKDALQLDWKMLPSEPEAPQNPADDPQQAVDTAKADYALQEQLLASRKKQAKVTPMLALGIAVPVLIATILGGIFLQPWVYIAGGALLLLSTALIFGIGASKAKALTAQLDTIYARHPGVKPSQWVKFAQAASQRQTEYLEKKNAYTAQKEALEQRRAQLDADSEQLTGGIGLADYRNGLLQKLQLHESYTSTLRQLETATQHAVALRAVAKIEPKPQSPDKLTLTAAETEEALASLRLEKQQLQLKLGQAMGQAEVLGDENLLRARLDTLNRRIARLEDTYYALELAQEALYQATTSLQRRFAPMISKHTQALFSKLTDGRYQRLAMSEDMTLSISAQDEDTLHNAQWRSDGTVDQLYLALRLAVARELTPDAPLVLDDALVRFDDSRLRKAMEILREESGSKQVIIFTCQSREQSV